MYIVDLFCGCGGFSTGAAMAGHHVVLAIDNWKEALECHRFNHPKAKHVLMELGGDLKQCVKLIKSAVPIGVKWHLHGSPPCQKLSRANRSSGSSKEGMRLVTWYLQLVKLCQPTSWSMEQVVGARHHLKSTDFEQFHIVNTADFGVPQSRRRLFIGAGWKLPPPIGTSGLSDVLPYLAKEGSLIRGYSNTTSVYDKDGKHLGNRKLEGLEGFRKITEPTFTLCAKGPFRLFTLGRYGKPEPVRNLTVDECKVIQGFPSQYSFPAHFSNSTCYKLIGNSVSPPIAFLMLR